MNVGIVGMGYVGMATAMVVCRAHHRVFTYDIDSWKVASMAEGRFVGTDLRVEQELTIYHGQGALEVASSLHEMIRRVSVLFICVPTPIDPASGRHDVAAICTYLDALTEFREMDGNYRVACVRSTISPDQVRTLQDRLRIHSSSGGDLIGLVMNPEFLREKMAWQDVLDPPYVIVGASSERAGDMVQACYGEIGPLRRIGMAEAAMVKVASNAFHAVKVDFANEIGALCRSVHVDAGVVMDTFTSDDKLNISSLYMKPGFSFGGSCLPKDITALQSMARDLGMEFPLLSSLLDSNNKNVIRTVNDCGCSDRDKVLVLGHALPRDESVQDQPFPLFLDELARRCESVIVYVPDLSVERMKFYQALVSRVTWTSEEAELPRDPDVIVVVGGLAVDALSGPSGWLNAARVIQLINISEPSTSTISAGEVDKQLDLQGGVVRPTGISIVSERQ